MAAMARLERKLSKFIHGAAGAVAMASRGRHWSRRSFVSASRPLQKDNADSAKDIKEAAEAVKEGAKEVRRTSEFVRDTAASAADSVSNMAKSVTEMTKDATETVKETTQKAKKTVQGAMGSATLAKKITQKVLGDDEE